MDIEISKETRAEAVASIKRYFSENFEPIGDLPAGLLLNFFLEELGPVVYNKAVEDAQTRIERHLGDLSGDLFASPFQYWPRAEARRRNSR
jgi:uncharacterized protein (DUF2164 family)